MYASVAATESPLASSISSLPSIESLVTHGNMKFDHGDMVSTYRLSRSDLDLSEVLP